ncbi:MAG: rod shape-determining protein MreC [Actinomycetota bacterium]|nr:rod shape-determining protein MreC [Actinomycetota bacterium]
MFSSLSRRRVVLLVVLTCLLLITLDKQGNPLTDRARRVFDVMLRPVDAATNAIVLPLERAWYGITNYEDLETENAALRDQIEHMRGTEIEARSAVLQYRELAKLNQLTSKYTFEFVTAEVDGDSPSNYQQTLEINVGSDRGIEVGMPVTDGAGLIGRITRVFPTRSIVLLITDPTFAVAARVLSTDEETDPGEVATEGSPPAETEAEPVDTTPVAEGSVEGETTTTLPAVIRETGTVEGRGGNRTLLLRFTESTSAITSVKVGAVVDTAGGTGSLAPQGIPIGTITTVLKQSGNSSTLVEVRPNADLRRLNYVAVVLFLPNVQAVGS